MPDALLPVAQSATREANSAPEEDHPPPPVIEEEQDGPIHRARIAVRGLDRDPSLARRILERLQSHRGVRAWASMLTGRVLVEYSELETPLNELLAEVARVELPPLPGEDRPAHPLDPSPLWQSVSRTLGASLGLTMIAARRLLARTGRPRGARAAAFTAAFLGLMRSFPFLRDGLRRMLGRDAADAVFSLASIASMTVAGSPLGLVLVGAEAVILLREVRGRRAAWRRYEERLEGVASAQPGAVIRLEPGETIPLTAQVTEGTGTAQGRDGLPVLIGPGSHVAAGARLFGGPFVLQLQGGEPFYPEPRPEPLAPTLYSRYLRAVGPFALGYAVLTALRTRSLARTFEALVLVNPRTALIGVEAANLQAAARDLRGGVTVVGTRPRRILRRPDVLLIDGPRVLTDGLEIANVLPLQGERDPAEVLALAGGVSAAAVSPWGNLFPRAGLESASEGTFNGIWATATVEGIRHTLGPPEDSQAIQECIQHHHRGGYLLALCRDGQEQPLGFLALRPRLSAGVTELVQTCDRLGVRLEVLPAGSPLAAEAVARRARIALAPADQIVPAIRSKQSDRQFVALVSDSARAAPAFAACDLAIGLSSGRSGRFPARADLLAPDLFAVAAIVEGGARRDATVRDSVLFSVAANVFGAVWGLRGRPGIARASRAVYVSATASLADGWIRLAGGQRPGASLAAMADPRPERWGRRGIASVLRTLNTTENGLSIGQAATRRRQKTPVTQRHELWTALLEQARSPATAILGGAAGFSLLAGHPLDAAIITATIGVNIGVGIWQEHSAGQAAEALRRLGTATARVVRDGQPVTIPAPEVVPGDVLLLAAGDRVAADARVVEAEGLEVDEAALTGESLPVPKIAEGGTAESQIILEGSDVVVGKGRAVVVAVGRHTRLGATAAALALEEGRQSPLGARLGRLLWQSLPLTAAASAVVVVSGLLRRRPLLPELAVGASLALAAVPEGLPLLAGVGQAGAARRLVRHRALVRRLSAIEALGRVDVACTDKTGTLTEGRLSLSLVTDGEHEAQLPGPLPEELRPILLTAALASPHPDATDAAAHPTDQAVVRAALELGLDQAVRQPREAEDPFDPLQAFHVAVVAGRLCAKGAPEALAPRCVRLRRHGREESLDEAGRETLLDRAQELAARGLRLLLVAEGSADTPLADPQQLVALGLVGISDPLRATVREAVHRCREAGVRVVMITGDHPLTARSIARAAGLLDQDDGVLTGAELAELQNGDLDRRLEQATVIARATPLDKVRIIEGLQRLGHVVSMTGDGVNDGPALRLADVGVAMGRGGTEVARQAADVVLADDDFSTLVEGLVEGREFWRNIRRSLGLLLGGNLGELGLAVGTSVLGLALPLNVRQILVVNLLTDALPALSVVLQQPAHRDLSSLAREGLAALDASLRRDVLRRGVSTAAPALAAYLLARGSSAGPRANAVAFGSIVTNQLAQTLDAGWAEGSLDRSVLGAVACSAGLLAAMMTVPPLRGLLGLALPTPLGWGLLGAGAFSAVAVNRLLLRGGGPENRHAK
jgi:calcium-translocating P-type ATPase